MNIILNTALPLFGIIFPGWVTAKIGLFEKKDITCLKFFGCVYGFVLPLVTALACFFDLTKGYRYDA